ALRNLALMDTSQRIAAYIESTSFRRLTESFNALSSLSLGLDRFTESFFSYVHNLPTAEVFAAREVVSRGWWYVPTWDVSLVIKLLSERSRRKTRLGVILVEHYRKQHCRELGRLVRGWDVAEFR